ncbi:hypothetical protein [Oceaniradius stylonematis]|uniref:hypothetical protein n=1 Tax=Oceaniradius stylonematis TaxID=2184161 RepID=UPI003C7BBE7C
MKFLLARDLDEYISGGKLKHLSRGFRIGRQTRYTSTILIDRLTNGSLRPRRADIALLTYDSFRHYHLDGGWFNIFQDPLRHFAARSGLTVETLEILNAFPPRRPAFARVFSVSVDTVMANIVARMGFAPTLTDRELRDLNRAIERALEEVGVTAADGFFVRLNSALRTLFTLARLFERHLASIGPRQIWMANYYSVSGMAMCLAGSRSGIPTVDISHGSSGNLHYAYSGFDGHPSGGYPILPSYFLSRHEGDAKALDSLVRNSSSHHPPIVVGDLAAHAWRDDAFGIASETRRKLELATRGAPVKKDKLDVLIAAQSIERLPNQVVEAMHAARGWCRFWIRFHPIYLRDIGDFNPPDGIEIPDLMATTTAPLFSLLERIDVVLTESSSVAEDGLYWDRPAVIVHPFGQNMFKEYIDEGRMLAASTSREIAEALSSIHLGTWRPVSGTASGTASADGQKARLMEFLNAI